MDGWMNNVDEWMTERLDEQMERQMNGRQGRRRQERDRREKRKNEWRQRLTKRPFTLHSFASYSTSFSWALSLVVWKLWLSSSTSFSKSERSSLNPELTGPISSSRMDPRNGCTLSAQLLSAGWATIAEVGNSQETVSDGKTGFRGTGARPGWTAPHGDTQ